jgi:hypothetical protein
MRSTRVTPELEDVVKKLAQLSPEKQGRWVKLVPLWLNRPEEFVRAEFRPYVPTLDDSVTPGNIHPEFDFGPPVGKERFWETPEPGFRRARHQCVGCSRAYRVSQANCCGFRWALALIMMLMIEGLSELQAASRAGRSSLGSVTK